MFSLQRQRRAQRGDLTHGSWVVGPTYPESKSKA